jgi:hypothetical protein
MTADGASDTARWGTLPNGEPLDLTTCARDGDRDKVAAYSLNVAGYLLKPVTFTSFVELMAALKKYWSLVEL